MSNDIELPLLTCARCGYIGKEVRVMLADPPLCYWRPECHPKDRPSPSVNGKHPFHDMLDEARKVVQCEGIYQNGDCLTLFAEWENDSDMCDPCIFLWKMDTFVDEAQDWWNELD